MSSTEETSVHEYYYLQALMSLGKEEPTWCQPPFASIVGWERYVWCKVGNTMVRCRDPRLAGEPGMWRFRTARDAVEVLRELLAVPQEYPLRAIHQTVTITNRDILKETA